MTHDLILRSARVIDPSQRLDAVTDIVFAAGKVARIGAIEFGAGVVCSIDGIGFIKP